jgi:hypothetical protein
VHLDFEPNLSGEAAKISSEVKHVPGVGLGSLERAEHLVHTAQALLDTDGSLHVVHVVERFPSLVSQGPDDWAVSVIDEAEKSCHCSASSCRFLHLSMFAQAVQPIPSWQLPLKRKRI